MTRKNLLLTTFAITSIALSGCTTAKTMLSSTNDLIKGVSGGLSYGVSEVVSFARLRGKSKKSDISFAENVETETSSEAGTYKTAVGEYVPTTPEPSDVATLDTETSDVKFVNVELFDLDPIETASTLVDTSPVPCPDGTYMTEDDTCASLETDTFDFADLTSDTVSLPVDTSPHPCPDDTYLAEDNTCMFLNNEATDFARDLAAQDVQVVVDTSPQACPEGTYLTADNSCLSSEIDTPVDLSTPTGTSVNPSMDFTLNPATVCPEGFKLNGKNGCMYLGASLQTKF